MELVSESMILVGLVVFFIWLASRCRVRLGLLWLLYIICSM